MAETPADRYHRLRERLEHHQIQQLFTEELQWGPPSRSSSPFTVTAGSHTLTVVEQARLGSVVVYGIDWPEAKLPGVTDRRAVRAQLADSRAYEHVVCYITNDGQRLAFSYARPQSTGRHEMRTLTYQLGSLSRTTVEQSVTVSFSCPMRSTRTSRPKMRRWT